MTTLFNKDALQGRMLFAIPKKGRLYEKCLELLSGADIQFRRQSRLDVALVMNHPMALVFLPAADIPRFVGEGNVDLGITGQDMVVESGLADLVAEEMELGFGKCKLQVQVPEADQELQTVEALVGKKVATSFDVLSRKYFKDLDAQVNEKRRREAQQQGREVEMLETKIEYVGGSVEAACALGVADGIGE
jgi:ATP phosphoribosyltransferase